MYNLVGWGEKLEICVRKNKNNRGSAQFIWFLFKKKVYLYFVATN